MAVLIEIMLEALEELLEEGMSVPLSGGRRVVDIDQARQLKNTVTMYCDSLLTSTQEQLKKVMTKLNSLKKILKNNK